MNDDLIYLFKIGQYITILLLISIFFMSFFIPVNWFVLIFLTQVIILLSDCRRNLLTSDLMDEDTFLSK
jgi:hypothetical protein